MSKLKSKTAELILQESATRVSKLIDENDLISGINFAIKWLKEQQVEREALHIEDYYFARLGDPTAQEKIMRALEKMEVK